MNERALPLEIYLFGGIRLRVAGEEILRFRNGKSAGLMAYLLLHRGRNPGRVEIATALFPEKAESEARTLLRSALHYLNQLLLPCADEEQPPLRVMREMIGFNTECDHWLDVEAFENLLMEAAGASADEAYQMRRQAIELYRGDLLAGHYEDWILVAQERLRSLYRAALQSVAAHEEQIECFQDAINHLRHLLTLNPLQEATHRALIRVLMQSGDRTAAQRQYQLCERVLSTELGIEPDAETQALRQQLGIVRRPLDNPLHEAHRELERGQEALTRGFLGRAERHLTRARRRLAELSDPMEAEALYQLGRVALRRSRHAMAKQHFDQAYDIARCRQLTRLEASLLNARGATESACGRLEQARRFYYRALRVAEQSHHPDVEWQVLNNLGRNDWLNGRFDAALHNYVRAQLICDRLSDRRGLAIVLQNMGTLLSHLGQFDEAHRCYREVAERSFEPNDLNRQRSLWHNWGDVFERQLTYGRAAECYRKGYEVSWELNHPLGCAEALCSLGRAFAALGDRRRAGRLLDRALRHAQDLDAAALELDIRTSRARLQLQEQQLDAAVAEITWVLDRIAQGVPCEEPEGAHLADAEIRRAQGQNRSAQQSLEAAWAIVTQRAEKITREDYRQSFLENVPLHVRIKALLDEGMKGSSG